MTYFFFGEVFKSVSETGSDNLPVIRLLPETGVVGTSSPKVLGTTNL